MKKLLAITALTVLTASSAFATTSYQSWHGQALQSYASADEMVSSSRDSATRTYSGFGPQNSTSSIVQ
jgi:opacity protein-like surface antigen